VKGIIDSGADISIMNGDIFKKVAAVAHIRNKEFKPPDKTPVGYDNRPFKLDGRLDLAITFADRTLHTTVYLKMDARDPLLLSEGACHQLGIIMYHPDVGAPSPQSSVTAVPVVRVKLVESVRLLPLQSKMITVEIEHGYSLDRPILIEALPSECSTVTDVQLECCLVNVTDTAPFKVMMTNSSGFTQHIDKADWAGQALEVVQVCCDASESSYAAPDGDVNSVKTIHSSDSEGAGWPQS